MIKYEDLSNEVKRGIENFRKNCPKILEDVEPTYDYGRDYSLGGPFEVFAFKNKNTKWRPVVSTVFASFCLASGAKFEELIEASRFAATKNYWLGPMEPLRIYHPITNEITYEHDYSTGKVTKNGNSNS